MVNIVVRLNSVNINVLYDQNFAIDIMYYDGKKLYHDARRFNSQKNVQSKISKPRSWQLKLPYYGWTILWFFVETRPVGLCTPTHCQTNPDLMMTFRSCYDIRPKNVYCRDVRTQTYLLLSLSVSCKARRMHLWHAWIFPAIISQITVISFDISKHEEYCNNGHPFETPLKLKPRVNLFVYNTRLSCCIVLKYCTEYRSNTAVFCAKFQYDLKTRK